MTLHVLLSVCGALQDAACDENHYAAYDAHYALTAVTTLILYMTLSVMLSVILIRSSG